MTGRHPPWIRHANGITTVDANYVRPGFASVHLVERGESVAIVDTGANSSVPLVLRALEELGIQTAAVEWLFLTHVHLDHAGGAGRLLQHLPRAKVAVHPRGAPHLIDPTRLQNATVAVYGQQKFEELYGQLVPIPGERVHHTDDGQELFLGPSRMQILHTPGHALHHQVWFDPEASVIFTGDTFGLSYRELDSDKGPFIVPTTTPSQFDPDQLLDSIERIVGLDPQWLYLTHFGPVTGAQRLSSALREQIERFVAIARQHGSSANRDELIRSDLREYLVARARAHGIADAAATIDRVLANDLELNTQGLVAWLARSEKRARELSWKR